MITEVHNSLLQVLRGGLKESISSENIVIGEISEKKSPSIAISNTEFQFVELSIGGSTQVKMERVEEKFSLDGEQKEFIIHQEPLKVGVTVESPKGTIYTESTDFTVDYERKTIRFFTPPQNPEKTLLISYSIKRGAAEIKNLKFILTYLLAVCDKTLTKRDDLVLAIIKTLHQQRKFLFSHGVDEITLIGGHSLNDPSENGIFTTWLEYQIEATVRIEIPVPPMEKIEIGERKI
jgi:hypothetical protein